MAQLGKSLVVRLVGLAVVVVIVMVVVVLLLDDGEDEPAGTKGLAVGDCVVMSGTPDVPEHEAVDCGDDHAAYRVTSDDGTCDESAEINYQLTSRNGKTGDVGDLCLALNAGKGDCFTGLEAAAFVTKLPCDEAKTDPDAQKVVSVGKAGDQCTTGSQPLKNATRDTVLCLGPVG